MKLDDLKSLYRAGWRPVGEFPLPYSDVPIEWWRNIYRPGEPFVTRETALDCVAAKPTAPAT